MSNRGSRRRRSEARAALQCKTCIFKGQGHREMPCKKCITTLKRTCYMGTMPENIALYMKAKKGLL